jgi:hypothetical protein
MRESHLAAIRVRASGVSLFFAVSLHACVLDMGGTAGDKRRDPSSAEEAGAREVPAADGAQSPAPSELDAAAPAEGGASQREASAADALLGDVQVAPVSEAGSDDAQVDPTDAALERDGAFDRDGALAVDAAGQGGAGDGGSPGSDAMVGGSDGGSEPKQCDLTGTFAVLVDYDVNWRGTTLAGVIPLLRAGRGTVRVWSLHEMRDGGTSSRLNGCGTIWPEFASGSPRVGTELYSAYIPSSTWERGPMPKWDLTWQPTCLSSGCAIMSSSLITTIGARLTGNSLWPGPDGSLSNLLVADHDSDGAPGVTVVPRGAPERSAMGTPYIEPPLSWTSSSRATRLYMALQIAFQLDGELESCDAMSGVVNQGRVENRIIGCQARSTSSQAENTCSPEQARFADENLPEWTVNAARWRARRISTGASCAEVRAALN